MADKFHGYDAITNLDMIYYQGNIINVRESKPKGNDSRGGGGGGYNNRGGGGGNRGGYNNNRSGGGSYGSGGGNRTGGSGRARTQSTYSRERNFNSDRNATGGGERANNFNRADNDFNMLKSLSALLKLFARSPPPVALRSLLKLRSRL